MTQHATYTAGVSRRLLTPRRLLTLLIAALLFTSLAKLQIATAIAGPPRRLLMLVLSPLQRPVHAFSNWARGEEPVTATADPAQLQDQNLRLAQRVAQLEDELRVAQQRIAELAQVRRDAGAQLKNVQLIDAGVTGWQGGASPMITINRGTGDGLAAGQVVTSGANLVGRVASVSTTTATVSLINQPGQLLDVRLKSPASAGTAGANSGGREMRLQLEATRGSESFIAVAARGDPIQAGDLAHLRLAEGVAATDSRWPDEAGGFVVGRVVRTEDDPNDPKLRMRVIVEPLRELRRLTRVMVLVKQ